MSACLHHLTAASQLLATTVGRHCNTRPLEITRQKYPKSNRGSRHADAHGPNHRPPSGGSHGSCILARSPDKRAPAEEENIGVRAKHSLRCDEANGFLTSWVLPASSEGGTKKRNAMRNDESLFSPPGSGYSLCSLCGHEERTAPFVVRGLDRRLTEREVSITQPTLPLLWFQHSCASPW